MLNEARPRLKAAQDELKTLWQGRDVEQSDFDIFVRNGKSLPEDRLRNYADYKPQEIPEAQPGESDRAAFDRGVLKHEQEILRYGDEANDYGRALAGVQEVLSSKGSLEEKPYGTMASGRPVSRLTDRWHDPLVQTTKEDLQNPDVVTVLGQRMDERLSRIGRSGLDDYYVRQGLEGRLPPETGYPKNKKELAEYADRDEAALEAANKDNGTLNQLRQSAQHMEQRADDVSRLIGETEATRAAKDKATRYRQAADKWEQDLKDRIAERREAAKPTPTKELLDRFDHPDAIDQLARGILETVPKNQIDAAIATQGIEGVSDLIRVRPETLGKTFAKAVAGHDPSDIQAALTRMGESDSYTWQYGPRKHSLTKGEIGLIEERAGKGISAWQSSVKGRPVWFTGHFVEFGEPPKGVKVLTEEAAKAEDRQIPNVAQVLPDPKTLKNTLTPIAREITGEGENSHAWVVALRSDGTHIFIDQDYWDHFETKHPGVKWVQGKDPLSPIAAMKGKELEGIVMPMRGSPSEVVQALGERENKDFSILR